MPSPMSAWPATVPQPGDPAGGSVCLDLQTQVNKSTLELGWGAMRSSAHQLPAEGLCPGFPPVTSTYWLWSKEKQGLAALGGVGCADAQAEP